MLKQIMLLLVLLVVMTLTKTSVEKKLHRHHNEKTVRWGDLKDGDSCWSSSQCISGRCGQKHVCW